MIDFNCSHCGKRFTVGDNLAGRKGTCKQCGTELLVPPSLPQLSEKIVINLSPTNAQAAVGLAPPPVVAPPVRPRSVRTRRLEADAAQVAQTFKNSPLIQIQETTGDPAEIYIVQYNVKGLVRGPSGAPIVRNQHVVEIRLTRDYPRQGPVCRMLTPIFHPNIEPAMICVGDHWTAGERLTDLIVRIGEMIAYQAYNIKSPLDGEAAMWADMNRTRLPIDNCNLQPIE